MAEKAVLLSFRLKDSRMIEGAPGASWWDKVDSKFKGWSENRFRAAGFRRFRRDHAPFRLYREKRRADALLRQCRRGGRSDHDRHLGDGWLLRPDQERHISGGAGIGGVLEVPFRPAR
jgi:2,3,4,5-tetrahydropyridine-2-carboxylate N-succinyltransferase